MKKLILWTLIFVFSFLFQKAQCLEIKEANGIYQIILPQDKKTAKQLKCVVVDDLMTTKEVHQKSQSIFTINGGFFDPINKKTVSYVTCDGHPCADPLFNENLFANPNTRKHMDKILNRSEFRILECFNGYRFEIAQHKSSIDFECQLLNSMQGGPLIYPQLQLEEEYFIVKDETGNIIRESASVLHKTPRTIVGLKNKNIYFLIFTDKHPVTLEEAAQHCEQLGLDRAMALDGGGSTSMNYKNKIEIISTPENGQGRLLKSFIYLEKK